MTKKKGSGKANAKDGTERFSLDLPIDTHRRIKERAGVMGVSVTHLIRTWVYERLEDEDRRTRETTG